MEKLRLLKAVEQDPNRQLSGAEIIGLNELEGMKEQQRNMSVLLEQEGLEDPQEESLALAIGIEVPKMSEPHTRDEEERNARRNWRLLALGDSEDSYYSQTVDNERSVKSRNNGVSNQNSQGNPPKKISVIKEQVSSRVVTPCLN